MLLSADTCISIFLFYPSESSLVSMIFSPALHYIVINFPFLIVCQGDSLQLLWYIILLYSLTPKYFRVYHLKTKIFDSTVA